MEKVLQVYKQQGRKLSTAKKIQFLQVPVASFVCELKSFSTVKVRVMAPLNSLTACLLSALPQRFSLILEILLTCIHPLQYTLTHTSYFSLHMLGSGVGS